MPAPQPYLPGRTRMPFDIPLPGPDAGGQTAQPPFPPIPPTPGNDDRQTLAALMAGQGPTPAGFPSSPFTVIPQPYSNDLPPEPPPDPYGGGLPPGWAPPSPPPAIDPNMLRGMMGRMPGGPGGPPTGAPYPKPGLMV